jgi:hypothetical protein
MTFTTGEIIAGVTAIVGIATTWATLSLRVKGLDDKLDGKSKDQGTRLGILEDRIGKLEGFVMGTRYRRKTKSQEESS